VGCPSEEDGVPTYQYACTDCGERLEVVQRFSDDPLTVCAACGGRLRKVFAPVGIVFKGSGFYRTDSRAKEPAAAGANGSADGKAAGDGASDGAKAGKAASDGAGSSGSGGSAKSDSSPGSSKAAAKVA
jgi:putative FmdB family regulatory protein